MDKFGEIPVLSYTLQNVPAQATPTQASVPPHPKQDVAAPFSAPAGDESIANTVQQQVLITDALVARVEPQAKELFVAFYNQRDPSMVPKVENLLETYELQQLLQVNERTTYCVKMIFLVQGNAGQIW
jgi:hypothetical protein